jgi:ABC-type transport system involved in Fe-S cluster assembly fused permease/ATPase subunit
MGWNSELMVRRRQSRPVGLLEIGRMLSREATPFVRLRLACLLVVVIAGAALSSLSPVALKFIVDGFAAHGADWPKSTLLLVSLYVLALWLARMANQVRQLAFAQVEQRVYRSLSERFFGHLMHLPLRFHLERSTGGIGQTLDNGLQGLRLILYHLVFTYIPVAVQLVTVLLVLVGLVTLPFLLFFFGALTCYVVAFAYSASAITDVARRASAAKVDATAAMTDGLLNYETVKYFTAEGLIQDRVSRALDRSESAWAGFYHRYAVNGMAMAIVFVAFLAGTVFYAMQEVQKGHMTVGDFVLLNTYMLQVVQPVEMMGYATQGVSQGVAMLEKLVHVFREQTEAGPQAGKHEAGGPGFLEFQEVCLAYGAGRPVLNKVSFRVAAGHTLGIVGPSGSGKSTVVRLLMRLLEPESGRILLDDAPISGMGLQDLRRLIAVVPQDTVLFDDTVRYNIGFGRADASQDEIEEAARIAQLHELVMTLPNGYDTLVGERGVKLSGGERQRVSIARAVLKSPRIYVFDEATSSLDSGTEQEILRSLRSVSRLNTTLVIAHRLSTVVSADEIVVLEGGQIAEHGTHRLLLRRKGRYAALWLAQQNGAAAA